MAASSRRRITPTPANWPRQLQRRRAPGRPLAEQQHSPGKRALLRRDGRRDVYWLELAEQHRRAKRLGAGGSGGLRWQRRAGPGLGIHADRASDGELLWRTGRGDFAGLELAESNGQSGVDGSGRGGYEQRRGARFGLGKERDESGHRQLLRRSGRRHADWLELAQQRWRAGGLARRRSGRFRWKRDDGPGVAVYADAPGNGALLRGRRGSHVSGLELAE